MSDIDVFVLGYVFKFHAAFLSTKRPHCLTVSLFVVYSLFNGLNTFPAQIFVDVQLRGTMFTGYDFMLRQLEDILIYFNNRQGGQQGEVESAVAGLVRLQSDHLVSYQAIEHHHPLNFVSIAGSRFCDQLCLAIIRQ